MAMDSQLWNRRRFVAPFTDETAVVKAPGIRRSETLDDDIDVEDCVLRGKKKGRGLKVSWKLWASIKNRP